MSFCKDLATVQSSSRVRTRDPTCETGRRAQPVRAGEALTAALTAGVATLVVVVTAEPATVVVVTAGSPVVVVVDAAGPVPSSTVMMALA